MKSYQALSQVRAARVLAQIFHEDPKLSDGLLSTYYRARYAHNPATRDALVGLLGFAPDPFVAEVNRFGQLIVFERKRPESTPPPKLFTNELELAPLSATSSWVCIECVDDRHPPNPVPDVALEIVTASADVRRARSNEAGTVLVDGIAPGRVTVRVLGMDGSLWRPLDGDPAQASPPEDRFAWHEVKQGECLSSIAHRYGFKYWQDVWQFRLNQKLREKRKSPHVLSPGDMLAVPAVPLYGVVRDTEQTHRIELKLTPEVPLDVVIEDLPGQPLAGHTCVLRFADKAGRLTVRTVTLDPDGRLKTTIPSSVKDATLELVDLGETLTLLLGALDPASDAASAATNLTGVQQRLCALGYGAQPTGRLDDATRLALARFQEEELGRDAASGEPDADTCARLEERYGV